MNDAVYSSGMDDTVRFVVTDVFRMEHVGTVLAPEFEPDRFPRDGRLDVSVTHRDGGVESHHVRFVVEHLLLKDGKGSRWVGVVVLEAEAARSIVPGDVVTARLVSPEPMR